MSDVETALVLRMEATLAKFEKQMARAKRVGREAAESTEQRFANSNRKMARTAEQSAQAIGREMDRLRTKYDPVFAASKRYEASLEELNRAYKLGAISAQQYEQALSELNAEYTKQGDSMSSVKREMEELRRKYDPIYAASRRYEASLDELTRAHKLGALSSKQYEAALETLNAEYTRNATGLGGMRAGVRGVTTVLGSAQGQIQNAAFQLGDFATQVGAGTSASIALGQQLPQLLGGFGALGAVLGAVVAIGVPLAAAFMRPGEEAKTLQDRLDALETAVNDYREAVDRAFIPTADLAKKYGTATLAAREFISALKEITRVDAMQALDDDINSFMGDFGKSAKATVADFEGIVGRVEELRGALSMDDPTAASTGMLPASLEERKAMLAELQRLEDLLPLVEDLADRYDISAAAAERLAVSMKAVDEAEGLKEKLAAMQAFIAALDETLGPYDQMSKAQQEVYKWAQESLDQIAQMVGAADQAASGISGAASEAGRLADELGRAVDNAISLAAQSISDVRRAEIEWKYRDDPVARAGALAAERVDQSTTLPEGTPGFVRDQAGAEIQRKRAEVVQNAQEAERIRQRLIEWRKQQAEANRGSRGGGGSKREQPGLFDKSDDQLLRLEREMEMLGKTSREVTELRTRYELLDAAKEKGLDLDRRSAATGQTLREEIDRQAASIGDLTERYGEARERAAFFEDQQKTVKDATLDAIVEGENLAGVLEDVAKAFAKAALEAAIFGTGPLSGQGGGSGWMGQIASAILGGGSTSFAPTSSPRPVARPRAAGGPVRAGDLYRVNENTPNSEFFAPSSNGAVLTVPQVQKAIGGDARMQTSLEVHVHGVEGHAVEKARVSQDGKRADITMRKIVRDVIGSGGADTAMRSRFGLQPGPKGG